MSKEQMIKDFVSQLNLSDLKVLERELYTRRGEIKRHPHIHIIYQSEYEGAHCAVCGTDYGWFCPDSPDNTCHYFTDNSDGQSVTLINGDVYKLTKRSDPRYESDDFCLFCGGPEERK